MEPHRSIRCPFSCGCVSVAARLRQCGKRWGFHPSLDSCLLPRLLVGYSLLHPVPGQERQGPSTGCHLRTSPSLRTQPLVGVNREREMINLEEEFRGLGATCLSDELVYWIMADWIPDPNGVDRILFSGNLELGLGQGRVRICN